MKNQLEFMEVIVVTNELGKEIFTKEGQLLFSETPKTGVGIRPSVSKLNTLGGRLTQLLKSKKMSSKKLAELTGINQSSISMMKTGKLGMSRESAIKFQEAGFGDAKSWLDLSIN